MRRFPSSLSLSNETNASIDMTIEQEAGRKKDEVHWFHSSSIESSSTNYFEEWGEVTHCAEKK